MHNIKLFLYQEIQNCKKGTWQNNVIVSNNPDILTSSFRKALQDIRVGTKIGFVAKSAVWNANVAESFDDLWCVIG